MKIVPEWLAVRWRAIRVTPELFESSVLLQDGIAHLIKDQGFGNKDKPLTNSWIPLILHAARLDALIAYVQTGGKKPDFNQSTRTPATSDPAP